MYRQITSNDENDISLNYKKQKKFYREANGKFEKIY